MVSNIELKIITDIPKTFNPKVLYKACSKTGISRPIILNEYLYFTSIKLREIKYAPIPAHMAWKNGKEVIRMIFVK